MMLKADLSLSAVVMVVSTIVGLAVAWQTLESKIEANEKDIAGLDARNAALRTQFENDVSREAANEIKVAETLTALRTELNMLKGGGDGR